MNATVDDRRELKRDLEDHPLVENVDYTRDGYQTLVLHLQGGQR
jgi:hypothetical protein